MAISETRASHYGNWQREGERKKMATELHENLQTISPTIDLSFLFKYVTHHLSAPRGKVRRYEGDAAIAYSVAPRIHAFARDEGWALDAPPITYAFGWYLAEISNDVANRIEEFSSDKRQNEIAAIRNHVGRLKTVLTAYATEQFPQYTEENGCLEILRKIPFMDPHTFKREKSGMIAQLKSSAGLNPAAKPIRQPYR